MTKLQITQKEINLLKDSGWCEGESQDCDWKRVEQIEKQILESQKIVEVLERDFPNIYEDIKQRIK